MKKKTFYRWLVRILISVFLVWLFLEGGEKGRKIFLEASPWVGLVALLTGSFSLLSGILVAVSLWKRRFFCQWVCPLGLLQDGVRQVRLAIRGKNGGRYRPVGMFLALLTLGTLWGGVGFLWLDPMVLLAGTGNGLNVGWLLAGILILALIFPFFWCFTVCPCGGMQDILWKIPRFWQKKRGEMAGIDSRRQFLKGTVFFILAGVGSYVSRSITCVQAFFRPPGAVEEGLFLSRCSRCGNCVKVCPTQFLQPVETLGEAWHTPQARLNEVGISNTVFCQADCVVCTQVCPTQALLPMLLMDKPRVKMASIQLDFTRCRLYYQRECNLCEQECPYGAISMVWSEEEYSQIPTIDDDLCTGCGRCIVSCPGEPSLDSGEEGLNAGGPKALVAIKNIPKNNTK
ncbi:MAG: 4Fe-4S binding protein [Planctomycetia bacterium]|nr:4Fe-4S binding protein [Planctomycetia bacterium]